MRYETLRAISGTTIRHQIGGNVPIDICHPSLTPELTMPVFQLPSELRLVEAVAVVYRDGSGQPIDGGFFGVTTDSEVVRIALVDTERGVNTDDDPAWTAFGLTMAIGKLLVKGEEAAYELPWSIVDFGEHAPDEEMTWQTPGRLAVRAAFCELRAQRQH